MRARRVLGQLIERALDLPVLVEGDDPAILSDLLGRRPRIAGLATRPIAGWVDEQMQAAYYVSDLISGLIDWADNALCKRRPRVLLPEPTHRHPPTLLVALALVDRPGLEDDLDGAAARRISTKLSTQKR